MRPLLLTSLLLAGCRPSATPAPVAAPSAGPDCPERVVLCGEEVATTASEVACVDAGVVDLDALRCLPTLTTLTLDDQSFPALGALDDGTLGRLRHLTVRPVTAPFDPMGWTTPAIDASPLRRLGLLETLTLEVRLDDPGALRGLTALSSLELAQPLEDATAVADLTHLRALRVTRLDDLRPLHRVRALRAVHGLGRQPGACALLARNHALREVSLDPELLDCPALVELPQLQRLSVSGGGDLSPLGASPTLREVALGSGTWRGLSALRQVEELEVWLPSDPEAASAVVASIASLKRLRRLKLAGGHASLEPLAALPALRELEGPVGLDLREVRSLRHLERLTWNGPGDSAHLAALTALRELDWDLSPNWERAPPLPALEVLRTRAYGDVAPLRHSPRLRVLEAGSVEGDLSILGDLTELRTLELRTRAADLSPLGRLKKLETLSLDGYAGDLAWLGELPALREVDLYGDAPKVDTFPPSLSLARLGLHGPMQPTLPIPPIEVKALHVGSRQSGRAGDDLGALRLRTIDFARGLRGLVSFSLTGAAVRSLAPLRGQRGLRELAIEGCPITNLTPLRDLPLRGLTVADAPLVDLSPLARTTNLRALDISRTSVDDVRPVARHPSLRVLVAAGAPWSHVGQLVDMPSLYLLDIEDTGVRDLAPLASRPSLRFLVAPATVTRFVALADLPLVAVRAERYDCASDAVVPLYQRPSSPGTCTPADELGPLTEDDGFRDAGDDDDPLDAPWEGP